MAFKLTIPKETKKRFSQEELDRTAAEVERLWRMVRKMEGEIMESGKENRELSLRLATATKKSERLMVRIAELENDNKRGSN